MTTTYTLRDLREAKAIPWERGEQCPVCDCRCSGDENEPNGTDEWCNDDDCECHVCTHPEDYIDRADFREEDPKFHHDFCTACKTFLEQED